MFSSAESAYLLRNIARDEVMAKAIIGREEDREYPNETKIDRSKETLVFLTALKEKINNYRGREGGVMSERHKIISECQAYTISVLPQNMTADETIVLVESHEQLRRDLKACQAENARLRDDVRQLAERVAIC